jgi:hypothetical protein
VDFPAVKIATKARRHKGTPRGLSLKKLGALVAIYSLSGNQPSAPGKQIFSIGK